MFHDVGALHAAPLRSNMCKPNLLDPLFFLPLRLEPHAALGEEQRIAVFHQHVITGNTLTPLIGDPRYGDILMLNNDSLH
ncbi:hypothetical protein SESI111939_18925 [Serratia silvae]